MTSVNYPFGTTQVFSYGEDEDALTVTLDAANFEFAAGQGDGYLDFLGYDRQDDPEYLAKTKLNSSGAAVWEGPAFVIPQLFAWRLQLLTQEKYETLWAMYRRQQSEKEPIILEDYRLVMSEPSPKTRTEVGEVMNAPDIAGMDYFCAVFAIRLEMGTRYQIFWDGNARLYELEMTAREILA
ncbi:hypothetical protein [Synechococcus sp. PCC 6312]|uniref:hypothetical protein n=1 Tax=Synechococcus sp. (strain ATCC 27167 / PCC 6312) TaxID=195253 RepID=UPI00029EEA7A|nr:hypothetical protein [Synechococcus sp. PCC 6312]AFY60365.1 hypothetical protein Syn6312_1180 [Synechococcus sp. PCC 6312]